MDLQLPCDIAKHFKAEKKKRKKKGEGTSYQDRQLGRSEKEGSAAANAGGFGTKLEGCDINFAAVANNTEPQAVSHRTLSGDVNFDSLVPQVPCSRWDFDVDQCILDNCPYTAMFATAVIHWLHKLQWPIAPQSDDGISLLELYVDCFLECGLSAPVQVAETCNATWGGHIRYELRTDSIRADNHSPHLSDQSKTWTRLFKWLIAKSSESDKLQYSNLHTLKHVGYRLLHASLHIRPILVHGTQSSVLLHRFFHTSHGKMKNLKGDFFISRGGG